MAMDKKTKQRAFDDSLLIEVEKYPSLYDVSCKEFKNVSLRTQTWRKVAESIGNGK